MPTPTKVAPAKPVAPAQPASAKPAPTKAAPAKPAPKAKAYEDRPVVTLIGRLGRDAEVKTVGADGKLVCEFSVAVDNGIGESKTTTWYRVSAWNGQVETTQHLAKGDRVALKGALKTTEKDGKTYYDVSAFFVLRAVEIEPPAMEMPDDEPEE